MPSQSRYCNSNAPTCNGVKFMNANLWASHNNGLLAVEMETLVRPQLERMGTGRMDDREEKQ